MRKSPRTQRYRLLGGPYAAPACRVGRKLYCRWRRRWVTVDGLTDAPVIVAVHSQVRPPLADPLRRPGPRGPGRVRVVRRGPLGGRPAEGLEVAAGARREPVHPGDAPAHPGHDPGEGGPRPDGRGSGRVADPRVAGQDECDPQGEAAPGRVPGGGPRGGQRPKSESFRTKLSERLKREWASGARRPHPPGRPWEAEEIARLGQAPDAVVAREIGRSPAAVQKRGSGWASPARRRPDRRPHASSSRPRRLACNIVRSEK